jgi:hypothetical protein
VTLGPGMTPGHTGGPPTICYQAPHADTTTYRPLEMYAVNPALVNSGRIDCRECVKPWEGPGDEGHEPMLWKE